MLELQVEEFFSTSHQIEYGADLENVWREQ